MSGAFPDPRRFGSRQRWPLLIVGALALMLAGCDEKAPPEQSAPGSLTLQPVSFDDVPGWPAADRLVDGFIPALLESCARFAPQPVDRPIGGDLPGTIGDWREPCEAARRVNPAEAAAVRAYVETWFRPFAAGNNGNREGLFTGYYEPLLNGSARRTDSYFYPLYRRPSDLVSVDLGQFRDSLKGERIAGRIDGGRLVPYPTRGDIDRGALSGRDLEILWVDDPTAAFFLHVQGSGRVRLPDGRTVRVGYDGQNGHVYASIGRELVRRGEMTVDQASLQSIRAWIADNPDQAWELFAHNPSYVFFRVLDGPGPIGAQGAPLTPLRSLAVDHRFVPYGVPVWLDLPDQDEPSGRMQRLVVAQDTGGAIRGPVRGDLFWGYGAEAERRAGRMKARGRYFILLPKQIAVRLDATG